MARKNGNSTKGAVERRAASEQRSGAWWDALVSTQKPPAATKARQPSGRRIGILAWILNAYHHRNELVALGLDKKKLDRLIERARPPQRPGRRTSLEARERYMLIVRIADRYRVEHPGSGDADAIRALVDRMRDSGECDWLKKPGDICREVSYTEKYLSRARKALSQ